MARKSDLIETILDLLAQQSQGLEVTEILDILSEEVSERGVRNLLNQLSNEGKIIKKRKENYQSRGTPPFVYFHIDKQELVSKSSYQFPQQLTIFDYVPDINRYQLETRTKIEETELSLDEKRSKSALEQIAQKHLEQNSYAKAIINIAPQIAQENPVDLVIGMAKWVVKDINTLGTKIQSKWQNGEIEEVKRLTVKLEERLTRARSYFQRFWRLDRPVEQIQGILDIPRQPKDFFQQGQRATFNEELARKKLQKRIIGETLIEEKITDINQHKAAIGTDASLAKIFLSHTQGSFIPPDPIIVTNAAAGMIIDSNNHQKLEYQDFDIFPDQLKEYQESEAAENGLVLSPYLVTADYLNEETFKRASTVAMDLRQYKEDLRVALGENNWRPVGRIEDLGIKNKPTLILRDGRIFPVVHRINFYESEGLYGKIVRKQIEKFSQSIHNTFSNPRGEIIYGAAVKNPELSWLSPLVFWYLHKEPESIVKAEDVYKYPFRDTVVSHLLFLGLAKNCHDFNNCNRLFLTCQVIRRFSDLAFVDTSLPITLVDENFSKKVIDEQEHNTLENWNIYIQQRIQRKEEEESLYILDPSDYEPFIYICQKVGVLMFYTAPISAYEFLVNDSSEGHFLIPRLEVAINLESNHNTYQQKLNKMLSWLTSEHWVLDQSHTQSGYESKEEKNNYPILVPDVVRLAHEVATFARDKLGEEVQDELRALIAKLTQDIQNRYPS